MVPLDIRFLVVDDQEHILRDVKHALRLLGFTGEIQTALNGELAYKALIDSVSNEAPVQFIICDIRMPGMNLSLIHI